MRANTPADGADLSLESLDVCRLSFVPCVPRRLIDNIQCQAAHTHCSTPTRQPAASNSNPECDPETGCEPLKPIIQVLDNLGSRLLSTVAVEPPKPLLTVRGVTPCNFS